MEQIARTGVLTAEPAKTPLPYAYKNKQVDLVGIIDDAAHQSELALEAGGGPVRLELKAL